MLVKTIIKIAKYLSNFKFSNNIIKKKIYSLTFIFIENFIFNNNKLDYLIDLKRKKNTNINIFVVPFWGEIYTKSFFENLLPSLRSKNNLEWIKKNYNIEIHLYVDSNFKIFQKKFGITNKFFKSYNFKISSIESFVDKNRDILSSKILNPYIDHAKKCLKQNAMSINICADFILPENYLKNIALITHGKPFCYTHTQIRTNKSIIKEIKKFRKNNKIEIDSENLVNLSLKHPFHHLAYQNDRLSKNATHYGISWRKIDDKTYSVVHGILGTFTFNFIKEDIYFLENLKKWSGHDRILPNYLLTSKRMKYISSSNLALVVEVTFENNSYISLRQNLFNDITKSNSLSSNIWNTVVGVWHK